VLIAQITDVHLGFEPGNPFEANRLRLDAVISALSAVDPAPDVLIVSGDLTESGTVGAYRDVRDALAVLPFPVIVAVGNHDVRANFLEVYPGLGDDNGFVQHVVEGFPLRIVVADTLEEGRHDGAFCARRAEWLDARLAEAPDRPTLLVLHHPPIPSGIDWMTTASGAPWTERLKVVVERHRQVTCALSGHLHRSMTAVWAGIPLITCSSTAPQIALDFKPMTGADMRPLIVDEPPAFALHRWSENEGMISYFGTASGARTIVPYDTRMERVIEEFKAENASEMLAA